MDNYDVTSNLIYSYYFFHGKSNPRQTLMLIQLTTCVGFGCRTRPECCLLRVGLHLIGSKLNEVCITDELQQEQNLSLALFVLGGIVSFLSAGNKVKTQIGKFYNCKNFYKC